VTPMYYEARPLKDRVRTWLTAQDDWVYLRQATAHFNIAPGDRLGRSHISGLLRNLVHTGHADSRVVGLTQYRIKP